MSDTPAPRREGSLEAPTRHPIDWRSPQFTDPAALDKELARVFDICHGCRRCFNLCNCVSDVVRCRRRDVERRGARRAEGGVLASRRALLSVRHVLHDEVPVRAAARVERRLPALDAAREGQGVRRRQGVVPRQDLELDGYRRLAGRHSRRRGSRQRRQRLEARPQAAREDARRRPRSARSEVSLAQRALAAQGSRRPRRRGRSPPAARTAASPCSRPATAIAITPASSRTSSPCSSTTTSASRWSAASAAAACRSSSSAT